MDTDCTSQRRHGNYHASFFSYYSSLFSSDSESTIFSSIVHVLMYDNLNGFSLNSSSKSNLKSSIFFLLYLYSTGHVTDDNFSKSFSFIVFILLISERKYVEFDFAISSTSLKSFLNVNSLLKILFRFSSAYLLL